MRVLTTMLIVRFIDYKAVYGVQYLGGNCMRSPSTKNGDRCRNEATTVLVDGERERDVAGTA